MGQGADMIGQAREMHAEVTSRAAWVDLRRGQEANLRQRLRNDLRIRLRAKVLRLATRGLVVAVRVLGLHSRGVRNAADIRLVELDFDFPHLPPAFDGYAIIHMSDLHADAFPPAIAAARRAIVGRRADMCVLTGDYIRGSRDSFDPALPPIRALLNEVETTDGIFGVLGNHDGVDAAQALERLGVTMLINQSVTIRRGDDAIHLTGTDDVHHFASPATNAALAAAPAGLKIALVHSAEQADQVAAAGFDLHLSGHTHGGQVCLPGGKPVLTLMRRYRRYARGRWQHGAMQGYTTTGVGVSGAPLRFNCRGEVALIRLHRR